eukprot:15451739-Alexandrium_andersonii.AAC.1
MRRPRIVRSKRLAPRIACHMESILHRSGQHGLLSNHSRIVQGGCCTPPSKGGALWAPLGKRLSMCPLVQFCSCRSQPNSGGGLESHMSNSLCWDSVYFLLRT